MPGPQIREFDEVHPSVCIIIPTRDRVDLLKACLNSIDIGSLDPRVEIVILDNDSNEPASLAYLRSIDGVSNITVLRYPGKFDYAGMCNFACEVTDAEFLCFVNNDTSFGSKDWLATCLSHFARDAQLGLLGSVLKYPNGDIQHAGVVIGEGRLASHLFAGQSPSSLESLPLCFEVSAVTFAFALTPRNLYLGLGGLDSNFKVGLNDVDYGLRVRESGYTVAVCGENLITHHESASRGSIYRITSAARAIVEVSRFVMKHFPLEKDRYFTSK